MSTIYIATAYLSENLDMEHFTGLDKFSVKKRLLEFLIEYLRDIYPDKYERLCMPISIEYIMNEDESYLDSRLEKIRRFLIKESKDPQITISKIDTAIINNKITDISQDYL